MGARSKQPTPVNPLDCRHLTWTGNPRTGVHCCGCGVSLAYLQTHTDGDPDLFGGGAA